MYKLIDSSSFFMEEDYQVTILNQPGSVDSLIKSAADAEVQRYVTDGLKVEPGKIYIHINAMGAGEYYGPNRNGDYFPEANLKEYCHTFVTSPAHVFRHHINKDPAKAIGKVLFATYNERMHRVELIAEVDTSLGKDIEDRMAAGDFPATSMACKTPYDVCSICGNKAHTRLEYCVHIKQHLGKVLPNGQRVMALNVAPLKFFDISIVIKPADITSSVLQKVAGVDVTSAELGEMEGLDYDAREKIASHRKLSELIKNVEGYVVGSDKSLESLLSQIKDPDVDAFNKLNSIPLEELLQAMGELGINPSLKFLAEMIAHRMGHHTPGIGHEVVEALREHGVSNLHFPNVEFGTQSTSSALVKRAMVNFVESCSVFPEYIEKRAYTTGYAAMGPKIIDTPEDVAARRRLLEANKPDIGVKKAISLLLTIGGAALWAKAYINSVIEKRLSEQRDKALVVKMAAVSIANELQEKPRNSSFEDFQAKLLSKGISKSGPVGSKVGTAMKAVSIAKAVANKITPD